MLSGRYQAFDAGIEACFQDPEIRERSFYPEFRRAWAAAFERACSTDSDYFDFGSAGNYSVQCECAGMSLEFHFDRMKICDWYERELANKKKLVFISKTVRRKRKGAELMFHDILCRVDNSADESSLEENMRNVIACAMPGPLPELRVVYGCKWVEKRFTVLRPNSQDIFLINTDYVPAFLGNAFEAAVYLFLMDYYFIKMNYRKVKDDDMKGLLHIIRTSPMLRIKGLA